MGLMAILRVFPAMGALYSLGAVGSYSGGPWIFQGAILQFLTLIGNRDLSIGL